MAKDKDPREEEDGIRYYTVERGVPIPEKDEVVPIKELAVGESIAFPEFKRNSVASLASRLKKDGEGEFITRKIGTDLCRVWRIN